MFELKKAKIASGGNIKLGASVGTWSKLMGDESYHIEKLNTTVCGTCGKYCLGCKKDCYVKASYRYGSVIFGHAIRTIAMRDHLDELAEQLAKQLERKKKPFAIIRINQSGELETEKELAMWVDLARKNTKTDFYLYTKVFDFVIPYLLKNADTLPENITILISVWHEYGIAEFKLVEHIPNVKAFVYLDGFDYAAHGLNILTKCNAYVGKKLNHELTCDKCKKCFDRCPNHKVIGCDAH